MKIAVLTSSRADYGIYKPLLNAFKQEKEIEFSLIVFGTHLSHEHGYTIYEIEKEGFPIEEKIETVISGDTPDKIAQSYALTCLKFADFWDRKNKQFDVVLALGDRYEMAAAVTSSIPFRIKIAHFHGGETTLGAIDNIYRHSISLASSLHFVSCEKHAERLKYILADEESAGFYNIHNVGSLSLQNINEIALLNETEFYEKWKVKINRETLLVTVHPETFSYEENDYFCQQLSTAIQELSLLFSCLITMPNSDTLGSIYRTEFKRLSDVTPNIFCIENLGTQSYFSAIALCGLVLGNSSSGLIEVASFGRYAINIGNRQKGRVANKNVIHLPFVSDEIVNGVNEFVGKDFSDENIFYKENTTELILKALMTLHE
jgi:GDP/UDP-N,N'-diacetylbacillosamine 2-epimerase (hydrolysing)